MLPCRLQSFDLIGTAIGSIYKGDKFYCLLFQALADRILILLAEILCSPREIAIQPALYVALTPSCLEVLLTLHCIVLA